MFAVRTRTMADVIAGYPFVLEIDEVKPLLRRMQAEIGNADNVFAPDAGTRPGQFVARDHHQLRIAGGGGIDLREQAGGQGGGSGRCK